MTNEYLNLSDVDLTDVFEPTIAQKGTEAELRIISMLVSEDKNGDKFIMPFFEIAEDPYSKEFGDLIYRPTKTMSPKKRNEATLKLIAFSTAFDLDLSNELDIKNEVVGKMGWAILDIGKDKEGRPTNKISKYVAGPKE